MVAFSHALMFLANVFVTHLLRLRTKYETFFVEEEYVRQPRTLGQDEIEFLFFVRGVSVRGWEKFPRIFGHGVSLLVDFLLSDCEHLLKIAMDCCLKHLVVLEASQKTSSLQFHFRPLKELRYAGESILLPMLSCVKSM